MRALIAAAAILWIGCASNTKPRESYVKAHPELDAETKRRILAGEVVAGMTAEQVLASLGGPLDMERLANGIVRWDYPSFVLVFQNGLLVNWVDKKTLY